jgi:hypothetical protein
VHICYYIARAHILQHSRCCHNVHHFGWCCVELSSHSSSLLHTPHSLFKAMHIIDELVKTEEEYVKDLSDIVSGYVRPLTERLRESDVKLMFSNIEDICAFHRTFLQKLKAAHPLTVGKVGTIFTNIGEAGFMVYGEYYIKHPKASEFLQMKQEDDVFKSTLNGCQMFLEHQLPLNYYLLKPVQRLLKYPLLLREMLKATTETAPMDYIAIKTASELMTKVATNINEIKRNGDITKYVTGLQDRLVGWDGPHLSTFGTLKDAGDFKVADSANKRSSRQVLLFEYGILICKVRPGNFVTVKHHFQMSDLFLQTMLNDPILFRLTLANNKKVFFTFHCQSQEDKQYWIAKIKKVMIDFYRDLSAREKLGSGKDATELGGSAEGAATDSPGTVEKANKKGLLRQKTKKRFNGPVDHLPPVQHTAETDETLMHNPFAHAGGFTGDAPAVKQFDLEPESNIGRKGSSRFSRKHKQRASNNSSLPSGYNGRPPSDVMTDLMEDDVIICCGSEVGSIADTITSATTFESESDSEPSLIVKCKFPGHTQTSIIVRSSGTATMLDSLGGKLKRRDLEASDCHIVGPDGKPIHWNADAFAALATLVKLSPDMLVLTVVMNETPTATRTTSACISEAEQERLDLQDSQTMHSFYFDETPDNAAQTETASPESGANNVLSPSSGPIVTKFKFDLVDISTSTSTDEPASEETSLHLTDDGNGVRRFVEHLQSPKFTGAAKNQRSPSLIRRVASYAKASIKNKIGSPQSKRRSGAGAGGVVVAGKSRLQPVIVATSDTSSRPSSIHSDLSKTEPAPLESPCGCTPGCDCYEAANVTDSSSIVQKIAQFNGTTQSSPFSASAMIALHGSAPKVGRSSLFHVRHSSPADTSRPAAAFADAHRVHDAATKPLARSASVSSPGGTISKLTALFEQKGSPHQPDAGSTRHCSFRPLPLPPTPTRTPPVPPGHRQQGSVFTSVRPPPPPPPPAQHIRLNPAPTHQHTLPDPKASTPVAAPATATAAEAAIKPLPSHLRKPAPSYSTVNASAGSSVKRKAYGNGSSLAEISKPAPAYTSVGFAPSSKKRATLPEYGLDGRPRSKRDSRDDSSAIVVLPEATDRVQPGVSKPPPVYRVRTTAMGAGGKEDADPNNGSTIPLAAALASHRGGSRRVRNEYDLDGRPISKRDSRDASTNQRSSKLSGSPIDSTAGAAVDVTTTDAWENDCEPGGRISPLKRAAPSCDDLGDEESQILSNAAVSSKMARSGDSNRPQKGRMNLRRSSGVPGGRRHTNV